MDTVLSNLLSQIMQGKLQKYENMQVVPLLEDIPVTLQYMTLQESILTNKFIVTEVSEGGSVPNLKVNNKLEMPVLLLDGEELSGAKQNRVLNTTILVKELSETLIPVSCTEQGRWGYSSRMFHDSDVVASTNVRSMKMMTVSHSLAAGMQYRSDQGAVWDEVGKLHKKSGVFSDTAAMKDVYDRKRTEIEDYLKAFTIVPGQKGLLVFINDKLAGFDMVVSEKAYNLYHQKLVKSYAMDALLGMSTVKINRKSDSVKEAESFIKLIVDCNEKKYESVGYGQDYRYELPGIVGSALVYNNEVVHTAIFAVSRRDNTGYISPVSRRRSYRI